MLNYILPTYSYLIWMEVIMFNKDISYRLGAPELNQINCGVYVKRWIVQLNDIILCCH